MEVKWVVAAYRLEPPRGAHNDVGWVLLEHLLVLLDGKAAKEVGHLHHLHVGAEALELVTYLVQTHIFLLAQMAAGALKDRFEGGQGLHSPRAVGARAAAACWATVERAQALEMQTKKVSAFLRARVDPLILRQQAAQSLPAAHIWTKAKLAIVGDAFDGSSSRLQLRADLKRELACVTEHEHGDLALHRLQLLQYRDHEDRRLSHARLGLAKDIGADHRLGYALVLDCTTELADSECDSKGGDKLPRSFEELRAGATGRPASPSEGCSKPQSTMARRSSGLSRKSLKPVE